MDSRSNTIARYKLLKKALQGVKDVPSSLLKACRSQGGLAKFSNPSAGIDSMALNTLKSSADQFIEDGGWARLDEMRKSYLSAGRVVGQKTLSKRTLADRQKEKIEELENALDIERRHRIRVQVAYESLLNCLRGIAKSDPEIGHFINRHAAVFSFKRLAVAGKDADDVSK